MIAVMIARAKNMIRRTREMGFLDRERYTADMIHLLEDFIEILEREAAKDTPDYPILQQQAKALGLCITSSCTLPYQHDGPHAGCKPPIEAEAQPMWNEERKFQRHARILSGGFDFVSVQCDCGAKFQCSTKTLPQFDAEIQAGKRYLLHLEEMKIRGEVERGE